MRKSMIFIIFLFITFTFAGCHNNDRKALNDNSVSPVSLISTESIDIATETPEVLPEERIKSTLTPIQSQTNWHKITQKKFSLSGDWAVNDDLYMNIFDNQSCSLDYSIIPYDWTNDDYNYESIYAQGISEVLEIKLKEEFGENVEQVYQSPSMKKLFIIVQDKAVDGSCTIDYSAWLYERETNNKKELFRTSDELDYYCPLNSISQSSVTWLQDEQKIFFRCGYEEFGHLLVDVDKSTLKSITLNSGCHVQPIPNFSGNGKKVILDDFGEQKIYWTDDYLNYLDQCLLERNSSSDMEFLDQDVSEAIYKDFQTKNLAKIPDRGEHWFNVDGWGFEDDYYYFLELGNGSFDANHNRSIDQINITTGEIEEVISTEQLKQNGIALSSLRVSVSPSGSYLLILNHTNEGRVFVVELN